MKLLKCGNLISGGVALLLGIALLLTAAALPKPLQSQHQAERWAGESGERFRQFTCVLSPGLTLEMNTIYGFRETVLKKLSETDLEITDGSAAICDAWSAAGTLKVSGPRGSFDAAALAVGGRFFAFHPMTLCNGGFLGEADLMKDRVVLDEQLAWMLFGSSDVAGMTIQIGNLEFFVAGVVAQPDDRFSRAAGGKTPTIYLNYASREALGDSGTVCYEVVLPDPVNGFAKGVVEGLFAKQGLVVENTDRFRFSASLRALRGIGSLGTRTTAVAFPPWENAAIMAETWCALARGGALLCFIWPAVLLVGALCVLLRRAAALLKRGGHGAKEALLDWRDQQRVRRIGRSGGHSKDPRG